MKTLRKVTVDGFKSVEHAEAELGNLNVVIGANGSGIRAVCHHFAAWLTRPEALGACPDV